MGNRESMLFRKFALPKFADVGSRWRVDMKRKGLLLISILLLSILLTGCDNDTVQSCIISNVQYTEKKDLEKAAQPDYLSAGKEAYACIYFVESPKGMKYNAKWFIDGVEVKSEEKEMVQDKQGIILYSLEGSKITGSRMKFEISYKKDIIYTKELNIQ